MQSDKEATLRDMEELYVKCRGELDEINARLRGPVASSREWRDLCAAQSRYYDLLDRYERRIESIRADIRSSH